MTSNAAARIVDSIIMPGAKIGKNVKITKAIVGEGAVIGSDSVVGEENGEIAVVGNQGKDWSVTK